MVLIEGVGNLSNHRLVAENGLKSENNQCELVSGFHQLNIKEYYQDFVCYWPPLVISKRENLTRSTFFAVLLGGEKNASPTPLQPLSIIMTTTTIIFA